MRISPKLGLVRLRAVSAASMVLLLLLLLVVVGLLSFSASAFALPEGRAYEQVSPEFKAGYSALPGPVALDGESVMFESYGSFDHEGGDAALNPYVARRTPEGWSTTALYPSEVGGVCWVREEVSPELSGFQFTATPGATGFDCSAAATNTIWQREANGSMVRSSPEMTTAAGIENQELVVGSSSDLSRSVMERFDPPSLHVTLGDETITGNQLYEVDPSELRLVAVDNSGRQLTLECNVYLGAGQARGAFDAVSQPDASEVFFSLPVKTRTGGTGLCNEAAGHPEELFVRVGGVKTLEISKPPAEAASCGAAVPCPGATAHAPAEFQGASEDGSRVFFTTAQALTGEGADASNDLYMATIGCPGGPGTGCEASQREVSSLTLVSHDPHAGQAAMAAPHVLAVSPDGSHVYFVAAGVLSESGNAQGEAPVDGAENLYVWDGSSLPGKVAFIADLCSGPEISGAATDARCPGSLNDEPADTYPINDSRLWNNGEAREAQTTNDGRFLVFVTYARLIGGGPEADTDSAKDVYRYDSQTGVLRRVSIGESGFDNNGNNSLNDAGIAGTTFTGKLRDQYEMTSRAISEGGTVVFTTAEPLSAGATNGQPDVYVWSEGQVGLISSGESTEADEDPIISPSGRDIVFGTAADLVPGDSDGLYDLYDARVEGGFPLAPATEEPCSGDACQGPLSPPAPLLVAGSIGQPAGRNVIAPIATKSKSKNGKAKKSKRKARKSKKKRKARKNKSKPKKSGRAARGSSRRAGSGRRGR